MQVKDKIKTLVRRLGYDITKRPELMSIAVEASPTDIEIMQGVQQFTMTSPERLWALLNAVKYTIAAQIPGDYVECGVWRGGSAMAMAQKVIACGTPDRRIWLYDTFRGMSSPSEFDKEAGAGRTAQELLDGSSPEETDGIWCVASLEEVQENVEGTGYPQDLVNFVAGDVRGTLKSSVPEHVALLRLDTDWYESTRAELEVLFPRLVHGGVCIIDDYGHWEGARKAVDEYIEMHELNVLMHRIDDTGRIFIKP